ncbi:MAG TPA: thiamine phosphate synthase [Acidobacteriaceae bacterium]|nr:thiamine phosphate synthase [Acidobacteriaceae bacterium]
MRDGFPRLYAIVDRATLDARGMSAREFARELRAAGVRLVQYRDKGNGPQEILRAAREIDAAFEGVEVIRVMNDRADLAVLAGWEGVHVGQGDLGVEAVRRVFDPTHHAMRPRDEWGTRMVGISTHNEEQVGAAVGAGPDYVAVGPVFRTASKANPEPVVGLELVRRARAMTELPVVAIGGITLANARSVIEAGADSVAVIGGLFVEGRRVSEVARDFLEILG